MSLLSSDYKKKNLNYTNHNTSFSILKKIPNFKNYNGHYICKTSFDNSIVSEIDVYDRHLSHSIYDIKFSYLDEDEEHQDKNKKEEIVLKQKEDLKNKSTCLDIENPKKQINTVFTHQFSKEDHKESIFKNTLFSNNDLDGESQSPKFKNCKATSKRGSMLSFKESKIIPGSSHKRSSLMCLIDKNSNVSELFLVSEIAKVYHFKTREGLIKNSNQDPLNLKSLKKIKNIKLENIKGKLLVEKFIIITPCGVENSKRKVKQDTISFFGYNEIDNVNDYALNNDNYIFNLKTFTKTLFAFSYEVNCDKYFIQPILDKDRQGRFICQKINKPYIFISEKILILNNNIIQIIPEKNNPSSLLIKVYEKENEKPVIFEFPDSLNGQIITIGSGKEAIIQVPDKDKIINSIHVELKYHKEKDIWEITDGYQGKNTQYGTWVAIDHKIGINEEMIIKIGEDILRVSLV